MTGTLTVTFRLGAVSEAQAIAVRNLIPSEIPLGRSHGHDETLVLESIEYASDATA